MEKKLQKMYLTYQFIDNTCFIASSYSDLINKISKRIIELHVCLDMEIQNVNYVELNISIATAFLNIQT